MTPKPIMDTIAIPIESPINVKTVWNCTTTNANIPHDINAIKSVSMLSLIIVIGVLTIYN